MKKLCGIIPAVASPCDERGVFLEDQFASLATHLYREGVQGLYVCGTTGDGYEMTVTERKQATEIALAVSRDSGGTVVTHVGANTSEDALALAEHAGGTGVDVVASRPPLDRNPAQWAEYYKQLGRVAQRPLLVYYIPALTSHKSTFDELLRLLDTDRVIGLKFSDYDLFLMQRLLLARPGLTVFNGNDEILAHGLLCGACGGIGMTYNLFPRFFVDLHEAVSARDLTRAFGLQKRFVAFLDVAVRHGLKASFEMLLRERRFITRCFRGVPAPRLDRAVLGAARSIWEPAKSA